MGLRRMKLQMKKDLAKLLENLSFSQRECDAFIKCLQVTKQAQQDESINALDRFKEIINEVVNDAV